VPTCFDVVGAPFWKGTTSAAVALEEFPLPAVGTMIWVALMVVLLTVPSTRTSSPFVMALAEVDFDFFSYFVEDDSSMVTFWPAEVVSVKLDFETMPTVPDAPPAAGPDRALDPPPDAAPPLDVLLDASCAADAGEDAARPTVSPSTGPITAVATIRRILR
jgi:hypothetical protein